MKKIPIIWYDDYCKDIFAEDPGLYDDVYMDLTFLEVMQEEGINAPAESFAKAFANADYKLWHATRQPDITYCMVLCRRHPGIGKIIRTLTILISRLKQTSLE